MIDAFKYYQDMEQSNIMLLFKGRITSDLLSSILLITENKLDRLAEEPRIKKRVFNVLVECLQNVYHHMDPNTNVHESMDELEAHDRHASIFMLGKQDDYFFITTGNYILRDKIEKLKGRIDELNAMSKEDLKDLYQDILTKEGFSEKGGAGLGFIDILRKSGEKMEYDFQDVNDKFAFFSLKAIVPSIPKN